MPSSQKILVIKLGALGDFIQALGPMAAIRRHHPKADITLLTTKSFVTFGEKCDYFNHVEIDEKPRFHEFRKWLLLRKNLNERGFDRVYDLQNNDRTCTYFKLFKKNKKPEWVGIAKGASHQNISKTRTAGLAFDGHVETLALAGIKDIEIDNLSWIKDTGDKFEISSPYILIVPGSAANRPEKRWPAEKYGELAHGLQKKGFSLVLLGTDLEFERCRKIQKGKAQRPVITNLAGQTSLFDIAALAKKAAYAIGNDTGPMHLIAATGCPCLVLFGSGSTPTRHAPKGKAVTILQSQDITALSINPDDFWSQPLKP